MAYFYTATRGIQRVLGTAQGGKPLWGGPFYSPKRDLAIVFAGLILTVGVVGAGVAAAGIWGALAGLFFGGLIMFAAMFAIGRLRHAGDNFSIEAFIAKKIDLHLTRPTVIDGPNPFHPDSAPRKGSKNLAPVDIIEGNIIVNREGRCWAEYRVGNPMEMGLAGPQQQSAVKTEHQALFKNLLTNGAFIAQIKEPYSANELIERSFTEFDADPEDLPLYSKLVIDQVDDLWDQAKDNPGDWPHKINYVIAVYVGNNTATAAQRRDEILSDLPFTWELTPATPAEMYWAWYSQCTAGIQLSGTGDIADIPEELPRTVIDDGAVTDSVATKRSRWFHRKRDLLPVLKVTTGDLPPSYQAVLTLKLPDELQFPDDTTFLQVLHEMGEPIRWAVRCSPVTREAVKYENNKMRGRIEDNLEELEPFDDNPDLYAREIELLNLYDAAMADTTASSVRPTILISVAANNAAEVKRIAKAVRDVLSPMDILVEDPEPGQQEELWTAMQPGAPRSPAIDRHAVETTVGEFAEMVPFTSARIGHDDGPIIAKNLTSGIGDLVRFAAEKLILAGRAAAIAIVASVGGGKSTLGKMLAIYAHVRGDPWGALDRSDIVDDEHPDGVGEWAKLAEVLPGVQVIDITKPPGSLDPLKVWADDPETASKHTFNMHVELLEELDGHQKLALAEALDPDTIVREKLRSQLRLAQYLINLPDEAAQLVGRKIRVWCRNRPFAAAVFDDALPALTLQARGTVIRTHGLALPSEEKILNAHLNAKLKPEERYAPVMYSLASVFLKTAFRRQGSRRGRPSYIFVDEAWTVTRNPIGMEILEVDIRDGRKHFVIVVLMTHDARRDLEHGAFRLLTTKFLGRAEDEELARSNLEWFNAMPITDDVVNELLSAKNGLFYASMVSDERSAEAEQRMRQVAKIQTLRPTDPEFLKALNTTPQMVRRGADELTGTAA